MMSIDVILFRPWVFRTLVPNVPLDEMYESFRRSNGLTRREQTADLSQLDVTILMIRQLSNSLHLLEQACHGYVRNMPATLGRLH